MRRGLLGLGVLGVLLACSGVRLPLGARWNNVEACQEYVRSYNALACVPDHDRLSLTDNCPRVLDDVPCDLSEHYACLAPRTVCTDGLVDVSAHIECGDRSCD